MALLDEKGKKKATAKTETLWNGQSPWAKALFMRLPSGREAAYPGLKDMLTGLTDTNIPQPLPDKFDFTTSVCVGPNVC